MKTALKLFSLALAVGALMVVSAGKASAAQLTNLKLTLSDSRPSQSTTHTYTFTTSTGAALKQITFQYCTLPSGTCTPPSATMSNTATEGTLTEAQMPAADWTLDAGAGTAIPKMQYIGSSAGNIAASTPLTVGINTISNHAVGNCTAAGNNSSDTCYVRVYTYSDYGSTLVDEGIVSYTVVASVTVTARVDPTFSFVVSQTAAGAVYNNITTSVASTYNTLPFGNLTAGTPKYAAHALTVTTNTQSGYQVTMKMLSQMTGVYTSNNIDPFTAPWGTPTAWSEPNGGTPNDNTGWIGANTTDTDVAGWTSGSSEKFGSVSSTAAIVSQKSSSDNGAAPVYVTYALEANVYQPADTYSGTLVYNALPTY